jgi:hypothetical protein
MTSKFTRTGARRAGDDYQDIIALDELVEMLKHPNRYKWIRVEADDAGSLDDVVALKGNNQILAKQVKFSTDPDREDDPWTFEKLLEKGSSKDGKPTKSLLEKWGSSFENLKKLGSSYDASVISNRKASGNLKAALSSDGLIDIDKIGDSNVRRDVANQLGDESKAREFFLQFHFYLDQQGLEEKEDSVLRKFRSLGGLDAGWLNLKDQLRDWIRDRNKPSSDGKITLSHVKRAALWYQLQSMAERFEIPKDYVIPSKDFHQAILEELSRLKKGCIVLNASPGVGKSTYLSYLFDHLEKINHPVIRHHYFLSLSDRTIERLNHLKIADSLMSDLERKYSIAMGDLETENPNPHNLAPWIEQCGRFFSEKGKSLVIIIDGLDHVWREKGSKEELDKLFEHLLPAPEGIIVVVGTQPIDDTQLPSRLMISAPRKLWKRLPLLDKDAIKQWLLFHKTEFDNFDEQKFLDFELDRFTEVFFKKSQGHPLHLRYTLKALQDQEIPVTLDNVEKMPSILHEDIYEYYNNLWRTLPESGKIILHLFAACNSNWQKDWISACLEPNGYSPIDIAEGFKQIAHLTIENPLGIQPFHNSILVFIENQEDYKSYSSKLKGYAIGWLQEKAPDYWKWAYEWRLLSEMGDYQPIINGPSRDWAIDALVKGYPSKDVLDILGESCWRALENADLSRGIEIGLLHDYAAAAYDNSEALEKMLYSQLFICEDRFLSPRLKKDISDLSGRELSLLAESEYKIGYKITAAKCYNELYRRLNTHESKSEQYNYDPWEAIVSPFLEVSVMVDDVHIRNIINFALINRKNNRSDFILNKFCYSSYVYKKINLFYKFLPVIVDLNAKERSKVFRHMILLALEENIDLDVDFIRKNCSFDPFIAIYAQFKKLDCFRLSNIQLPSYDFLNLDSSRQFNQLGYIEDSIYEIFFCLFANYLWKSYTNNEVWVKGLEGKSAYPYKLMLKLNIIAKDLADLIILDRTPSIGWFYTQINDMPKITFREDRDYYQYAIAAERAMDRISLDIFVLSLFRDESLLIQKSDLELGFESDLFDIWRWLDNYVSKRRQWIETSAVEWLIHNQKSKLENSVAGFPERALNCSILASLATTHNLKEDARELIKDAAKNLISYGWHKDLLLHYLLESIEKCYDAGIGDARQWAIDLSPIIAKVRGFTDGDETRHLPRLLADLLAKTDTHLAINYYQWLCGKEEYYDALSAFHSFLRIADLSDSINQAIAKTAMDDESILILNERADSGDPGAKAVLFTILDLLGEKIIDYLKLKASQRESSRKEEFIEPTLPLPQDFPPDKLADYLSIAKTGSSYLGGDAIVLWIDFWKTKDRKREAFEAVVEEVDKGLNFRNYYVLFELAHSLYGKDDAYPWLIKSSSGLLDIWSYYWLSEEQSIKQMDMVKKYYPSKWLDFILETIKSPYGEPWYRLNIYNRFQRLIIYCIMFGQSKIAEDILHKAINFAIDLTSALKLSTPEWVVKDE